MTRFLAVLIVALVVVPAALADGPMANATQNGAGLLLPGGITRVVAVGAYGARTTMLEHVSTATGSVDYVTALDGAWGIPNVVPNRTEGLSADRKVLVLGQANITSYPRRHSSFLLVNPRSLRIEDTITLPGDFVYDALSPDGTRLYLIKHTSRSDLSRYVVRAFDVTTQRLLPGRIADREQKSWVMRGYPVDRVSSPGGRMVYTLYANPGGFPFVHALDTVRGVARCIGLPWRGGANAPFNMRLALAGTTLRVHWYSGRPWLKLDTRTWRMAPDRQGFPWWTLWFLAFVPLTLLLVWRRYHRLLNGGRTATVAARTA